MRTHILLEDADGLIALAESVATVLFEKQHELKMDTQIESLLRASIAGAKNGINIYLGFADVRKSPVARKYLAETRKHCRRSLEHLRRRVRQSIAYLSRVIGEQQFIRSVDNFPL
jgi:hypothetical protein